jgi:hypothetical protein
VWRRKRATLRQGSVAGSKHAELIMAAEARVTAAVEVRSRESAAAEAIATGQ